MKKYYSYEKSHNTAIYRYPDGSISGHGACSEQLLQHKNITDYLFPEFCISCAYFKQVKGNYGTCTAVGETKKFDGTRKGSGCQGWRLKNELTLIKIKSSKPQEIIKKIDIQDLLIDNYNEKAKKKKELYEDRENPEILKQNKNWKFGLPYARTSDVIVKRAVYHKHRSKHTIKIVLRLRDQGLNLSQIHLQMNKYLSIKISLGTIRDWCVTFMSWKYTKRIVSNIENIFGQFWTSVLEEYQMCPFCQSCNIIKRGKTEKGRFFCYCKFCHNNFTEKQNFWKKRFEPEIIIYAINLNQRDKKSANEITTLIKQRFNQTVSCLVVLRWLREYSPNYSIYATRPKKEVKN